MAFYWPYVFKTKVYKKVVGIKNRFYRPLAANHEIKKSRAKKGYFIYKIVNKAAKFLIFCLHGKAGQEFGYPAHIGANGHFIVIQNHDKGERKLACMGQGFIGKAPGKSPVAYHGHGPIPSGEDIIRRQHAQSSRN